LKLRVSHKLRIQDFISKKSLNQSFNLIYSKFGFVKENKKTISKKSLHFFLGLLNTAHIFCDKSISSGVVFNLKNSQNLFKSFVSKV